MARGNTDLSSNDYDNWLSKNGKSKELRERNVERRKAHDVNGKGWHFGLGDSPVKCKNRDELRSECNKRGLMLRDDVKKDLR